MIKEKYTQVKDNPLREGRRIGRTPDPVAMVIFGATGDLTARKLVPALFSLAVENRLPANFRVIGFARRPWSHEEFREEMKKGVEEHGRYKPSKDPAVWESFAKNCYFVPGNFSDENDFEKIDQLIQ